MNDFENMLRETVSIPGDRGGRDDAALLAVFNRAEKFADPLDAFLKQDIVVPLAVLESMEDLLLQRIHTAPDRCLETALIAEQVLLAGQLDALEDKLMDRIEHADSFARPRVVWPLFALFGSLLTSRMAKALATACVVLVTGASLYFLLPGMQETDLQTVMVQASGTAFQPDLDAPIKSGSSLECNRDGSFTLASKAGTVTVRDDASLQISRATTHSVEYRVFGAAPSGRLRGSGSVEFSVVKQKRSQRYTVVTPWYDIRVVGTKFLVQNDYRGTLSTVLLEGKVKIESRFFGDTSLSAGQTLTVDPVRNTWIIGPSSNAGQPLTETGAATGPLCRMLVLSAPAGASVFINSQYRGTTPYAAALPAGACSLSVFSEGRAPRDTVIRLQNAPVTLEFSLAPLEMPAAPAPVSGLAPAAPPVRAPRQIVREKPAGISPQEAKLILDKAQRSEGADWKLSLGLYRQIASSLSTPAQYRETALFSLGRLTADRLRDTAAAMNDFSTYAIQYPRGLFAGEALLRLAELERSRNPASAVEYFRTFIALCPDHPRRAEAAYYTGLLFKQNGNSAEALQMFTIALAQTAAKDTVRAHELQRQIEGLRAERATASSKPLR